MNKKSIIGPKTIAVIPVKSTSTRVVNKNVRLLGDKPLFIHTLDKLLKIDEIDEIWIDTDDLDIVEMAKNYGCIGFKYFIRDKKYASNSTDGNKLLENEIKNIKSDIYLQVLCTSPFTKIESIKTCINLLKEGAAQSVVGCFKEKFYLWKDNDTVYDKFNIPNSNMLEDTIVETMSLYGIWKKEFDKSKLRIGNISQLLFLEGEETIDINYEKDFDYANRLAKLNVIEEHFVFDNLKVKLNSCVLADILNELGYNNCVLNDFKLNMRHRKLFGRVKPIQIRELRKTEDANNIYDCLKSYNSICPGNIIFVNNKIDNKAYFGDLNATISLTKHAQGTIVNGYTRDINRTIDLNYPVFYKNNTCNDVKLHGTLDYYDKPIVVGGITIYVNDLIFADVDGIVVIPRNIEKKVLEKCMEVIDTEKKISQSIILGENINTIIKKFGTF